MKDFLGKELKVGSSIVYPTRRGSDLRMISGVIKEIRDDKLKVVRKVNKWVSQGDTYKKITVDKLVTLWCVDKVVQV